SADFWTEAVVTETRTLALALDTLILVLLVVPRPPAAPPLPDPGRRAQRPGSGSARRAQCAGRHVLLAAVLYGLALSDHLLSLYLAPALIVLAWPATAVAGQTTGTAVLRRWLMVLGCCLAGLTCYAY